MTAPLSDSELAFLRSRHPPGTLARVATVDVNGVPHVVPSGWRWDENAGEIALGGRDVARTRRAEHVRRTSVAALVIDGVDLSGGWAPWGLAIRGAARVDDDAGEMRVRPDRVSSWGLETVLANLAPTR